MKLMCSIAALLCGIVGAACGSADAGPTSVESSEAALEGSATGTATTETATTGAATSTPSSTPDENIDPAATSTAVADSTPESDPITDGTIVGIVTLSPAAKSASLEDLCVAEGATFALDTNPALDETTAFAVFSSGGVEVDRIPFLSSQVVGGSMEFGPVVGFFDEPSAPGSRDAITLPFYDASLVIEIEGTAVSPEVDAAEIGRLPRCSGTSAG